MNNNFDKVLLVGAVVACGAGAGFYVWKKDAPATATTATVLSQVPSGIRYEPKAVPQVEVGEGEWKQPHSENSTVLWTYDLFTPAEVRWDEQVRKYRAKADTGEVAPFGIKLVSISHPVYRITLRGHVKGKDEKTGASIVSVLLYDEEALADGAGERGKWVRAQEGGVLADGKIVVKKIDLQEVKNADGTITRHLTTDVFDQDLNQTLRLTLEKPYEFKDTVNVTVAAADDPSRQWILHQAGEQIKDPELGTFTLKGIDFDARTVNFEKLYKPNPHKPEQVESATLSEAVPPTTSRASE